MKVLFDHQLFSYQRYGGASKYFAELLANLPREMWETTTIFSNNEYVKSLNLFKCKHFLLNKYFRGQGRIMNELNKPHSIKIIKEQNFDVFHETHFETYCLKPLGNKPMVTTFHDINFSTFNKNPKIVKLQRKSLERADHVITISENTKKDMMRLFDIDESKITVIYHGIEPVDLSSLPRTKLIKEPYILYVGSRSGNKNFDRFIQAFAELHKKCPEILLVCTRSVFSKTEKENMNNLGCLDSVKYIGANEGEMLRLYRDCEFFVFPSLYEGFGMPLLEAMACGAPVACSNASCFPEIAKDAALYFEPTSIDDMKEKMIHLLEDENLRNELIMKGETRVKDFSWKKCAEEHMKVYEALI